MTQINKQTVRKNKDSSYCHSIMGPFSTEEEKNINLTCIEDNLDHIHDIKEASDAMQVTGQLV